MESNKFEKDFRNKLNKREIALSENSWDRLDAMLTVAEKKQPKKSNGWVYIAASIIGFIFIGTVFFSQTEELIDIKKTEVVLENQEITKPTEETIIKKEEVPVINKSAIATTNSIKKTEKSISKIKPVLIEKETIQENQNQLVSNEKPTETIIQKDIPNEIVATTEIAKPSVKVDANKLLSEVDGELDLSFRERMVQKVNKNYRAVKVAVANRNQE